MAAVAFAGAGAHQAVGDHSTGGVKQVKQSVKHSQPLSRSAAQRCAVPLLRASAGGDSETATTGSSSRRFALLGATSAAAALAASPALAFDNPLEGLSLAKRYNQAGFLLGPVQLTHERLKELRRDEAGLSGDDLGRAWQILLATSWTRILCPRISS